MTLTPIKSKRLHNDTIEEVKLRADIVDVVSEHVALKKQGKDYMGLCPFHKEKTPSFSVSRGKQLWHCFGCNESGNVFQFLMQLNRTSFQDAVLELARDFSVRVKYEDGSTDDSPLPPRPRRPLPPPEPKLRAEEPKEDYTVSRKHVKNSVRRLLHQKGEPQEKALAWLESRGITREMVTYYRLGLEKRVVVPDKSKPEEKQTYWAIAIFIPVPDRPGQFYMKKRVAPWLTGNERPDYLAPWSQPGVQATVWFTYNPDNATETWFCEGEWDAIALSWLAKEKGATVAVACSTAGCSKVPSSEELARLPGQVIVFYDRNDAPDKNGCRPGDEGAKKLAIALSERGRVGQVPMPSDCTIKGWDVSDALAAGYTWDDFVAAAAVAETPEFIQRLEAELHAKSKASDVADTSSDEEKPKRPPKASFVAAVLAEKYRNQLAWRDDEESWYRYEADSCGIWSQETEIAVEAVILAELETLLGYTFGSAYLSDVTRLLKRKLIKKHWDERGDLIPLLDGVLRKDTLELLPHSPGYHLTWNLPIRWADRKVGCEPIEGWMLEIMKGDPTLVRVLRALLNCIIFGRANYQRYLEAIGPGGTGKGTFFRLASALVGDKNVMSTTLKQLEENRFEVGALRNVKLLLITEVEKHGGEVNVLKALTGEDKNRVEVKGRQRKPGDDFYFQGFVFVSGNEQPQSSDYTSGLDRRRLSVPFTHQTSENDRRDLGAEFQPYLAGLLEWVLTMPEPEVRALVVNTKKTVPALARVWGEALCDANPLADWLDNCIIHDAGAKTYVGVDSLERVDSWLYANYTNHTRLTNGRVIGQRRYTKLLEDLCCNQLKLPGVKRGRDRKGSYFEGLRIRTNIDTDPRPITGQEPPDILPGGGNPPGGSPGGSPTISGNSSEQGSSPSSDSVTETMVDCDGLVTAETLGSDECDGCDAYDDIERNDQKIEAAEIFQSAATVASVELENQNFPANANSEANSVTAAETITVREFQSSHPINTTHHNPSRRSHSDAEEIKNRLLEADSREELTAVKREFGEQFLWVWRHLLTRAEKEKIEAIVKTDPLSLLESPGAVCEAGSFKVSDRVFVNSCPHTDKWGPYLIESIEGNCAKVELFPNLIPFSNLRLAT